MSISFLPFCVDGLEAGVGNENYQFFSLDWVKTNCLNYKESRGGHQWGIFFACILWGLWKARCSRSLEGKRTSHHRVFHYATLYTLR